ncbi:MAG: cupin domain-containing protein [Acidobacteriota bacterium]
MTAEDTQGDNAKAGNLRDETSLELSPEARRRVAQLGLQAHPEGGFFREVYRSPGTVIRQGEVRNALTTIYFLLAAGQFSRWHVVASDEVWHFYEGSPLELWIYDPELAAKEGDASPSDSLRHVVLGGQVDGASGGSGDSFGERVAVVPAGCWQAARPLGDYSLVGCTVGPGFDFADFRFVAEDEGHGEPFEGLLAGLDGLL